MTASPAPHRAGITALCSLIAGHDRFVLISHVEPDGDAVGSVLALQLMLERLGKEAVLVASEGDPLAFAYLDGPGWLGAAPADLADRVVIALDCATEARLAWDGDLATARASVNVDHHDSNTRYAGLDVVAPDAAATCEVLAWLAPELGLEIDDALARRLYTGLRTDTRRSERSGELPAATEALLASLRARIAGPDAFDDDIERVDPRWLALAATALNRRRAAHGSLVATLTLADLAAAGVEEALEKAAFTVALEALTEEARAGGARAVAVAWERSGGRRLASLRGIDERVDASGIASRLYGGGGHRAAAGMSVPGGESLDACVERLAAEVARTGGSAPAADGHVPRPHD